MIYIWYFGFAFACYFIWCFEKKASIHYTSHERINFLKIFGSRRKSHQVKLNKINWRRRKQLHKNRDYCICLMDWPGLWYWARIQMFGIWRAKKFPWRGCLTSILARLHGQEPWWATVLRDSQRVGYDWVTSFHYLMDPLFTQYCTGHHVRKKQGWIFDLLLWET